jgi:hypothetical protein
VAYPKNPARPRPETAPLVLPGASANPRVLGRAKSWWIGQPPVAPQTQNPSAGTVALYYCPIIRPTPIVAVLAEVTSAVAATTVTPLIYRQVGDMLEAVYIGPPLDSTTTGNKLTNLAQEITLPAPGVWLGTMALGGAPSMRACSSIQWGPWSGDATGPATTGQGIGGLQFINSYPAAPTQLHLRSATDCIGSAGAPILWLRVAR